jgi:hypothetical protein
MVAGEFVSAVASGTPAFPAPQFLGSIAKFRKANISVIMSVCPSAWDNSAPNGRVFMTSDI